MQLRASCTVRLLLRARASHAFARCQHSNSSRSSTCASSSRITSPLQFRTVLSPPFRTPEALRGLSTSSRRNVPWLPIMAIVSRKAFRLVAALAGGLIRRWYKGLPQDKRGLFVALYRKHKNIILAVVASLFSLLVVFYASHIERTPVTGRLRFITVTHAQLEKIAGFELEQHLALHSRHLLPDRDRRVVMVRRALAKLISGNKDFPHINDHEWKVLVVDDHTVSNAFVLPTGHIFFFTGMLDTLENEEQLGIVLSHEMAHTLLGHGLENMSYTKFLDWIQIVVLAAIWTILPSDGIAFVTTWFYNLCQQTVLDLPFSRKLEIEADAVGLQIAAKACFDVRESYAYWIGMHVHEKANEQKPVPSIFSTHPDHGDRAERLKSLIDSAVELRTLCNCPPLDLRKDPIKRADSMKIHMHQQLALQGKV
uniref:Metalloendopeptidase OMA1, mitochondrial n=1 Tax=Plectus sambesii TaxID=2011161 RepID=A0A914W6T8_9BILA